MTIPGSPKAQARRVEITRAAGGSRVVPGSTVEPGVGTRRQHRRRRRLNVPAPCHPKQYRLFSHLEALAPGPPNPTARGNIHASGSHERPPQSLVDRGCDRPQSAHFVAKLHEVAETLPAGDERAQVLESVAERWLASAPGLRPSIAAVLLGLSEPTVRAWAKRGILRVRSGKPRLLLDPASVLEVRQLVSELRLAGQTRDLFDEVYNRLADEQQLADPDLAESLAQMHQGEYIVRRQPTG